ncbi:hypothetical protein WA026_008217 [Henosepilachna vigintioctopunctata]|uniref:Uncharacterized protein n=1 Tax=Henosepilachna vigintioctopunctata TaxID=420089 RepID=A0AAW1TIQ6_9CUCU
MEPNELRVWKLPTPDGVESVTYEEKEKFQEIKERIQILLEKQKLISVAHATYTPPDPTAFAWFSDLLVEHAEEGALEATPYYPY